ncbi:27487_t:CDS:2 [Dentiscutata erythropus]|uniref:27487_t:CDS:1 n=1 Tax=Dentiscutata erythropus TaxID=1348616 RepID=A0A9N9F3X7_9GLOM|nr:27487_t:CDS:2 [Dentiscutata erythropus]
MLKSPFKEFVTHNKVKKLKLRALNENDDCAKDLDVDPEDSDLRVTDPVTRGNQRRVYDIISKLVIQVSK